jgi:hypothetical protein
MAAKVEAKRRPGLSRPPYPSEAPKVRPIAAKVEAKRRPGLSRPPYPSKAPKVRPIAAQANGLG